MTYIKQIMKNLDMILETEGGMELNTGIYQAELVNGIVDDSMSTHGFITNGGSHYITSSPSYYPELEFELMEVHELEGLMEELEF